MEIRKRHLVRAGMGLAVLSVVGFMTSEIYDAARSAFGEQDARFAGTVGAIRQAKLEQLTQDYLAEKPNGMILMMDGERLAPLPYLNRELRERDASWRVRIDEGQVRFQEVT